MNKEDYIEEGLGQLDKFLNLIVGHRLHGDDF